MKFLVCCLLLAVATGAQADRVDAPGAASDAAFAARAPVAVATATSCVTILATRMRYAAFIWYRALKWKWLEVSAGDGGGWATRFAVAPNDF